MVHVHLVIIRLSLFVILFHIFHIHKYTRIQYLLLLLLRTLQLAYPHHQSLRIRIQGPPMLLWHQNHIRPHTPHIKKKLQNPTDIIQPKRDFITPFQTRQRQRQQQQQQHV